MTVSVNRRPTPQEILALKGRTLRVPELLALFSARVRNHQTVPVIVDALREVGLDTVPSFTTCGINTDMLVVDLEPGDLTDDDEEEELSPGTLPQQSFKIGDIPSARGGVDSVLSSAPLSQATHTMLTKNYSQLPVIDGVSNLRGVITWRSVAMRYENGAIPTLANAMVTESLPVAEVHQELFAHLPAVSEHGYFLVRSNSGRITGIVTAADITARFHDTALPFFLVGEIEFQLRRCLGALPEDGIRAVQPNRPGKQTGKIADLMFGDYVKLLRADPNNQQLCANADNNWHALGWAGVDRTQFVHHLNQVRATRNQIAHFSSDPLAPQQITELRQFVGLLKLLA